jgi:hypothetical protein
MVTKYVARRRATRGGGWPMCVLVAAMTAACAPSPLTPPRSGRPMNKPVPLGSDASSGALEAARQQLMGVWELVDLKNAPPQGGTPVAVKATGTLTYDQYGNLTIDARTADPAAPVAAREVPRVSFKGRAVIDVVNRELKLMDLTGNVNPDEVLAPERRRRYAFEADLLTLSSFDDRGTVTAVATWRRTK